MVTLCSCFEKPEFEGYHVEITGLSQGQYYYLSEYKDRDYGLTDKQRQAYVIVETVEEYDESVQKNYYSVKIRFGKESYVDPLEKLSQKQTVKKYYDWFMNNYYSRLDSLEPAGSRVRIIHTEYMRDIVD